MQSLAGNRIPGYLQRTRDRDIVLYDLGEDARGKRCQFVHIADEKLRSRKNADEPTGTRCRRGRRGQVATGRSLRPSLPSRWHGNRPAASAWLSLSAGSARPGAGGWRVPASMWERRRRGEPRHQRPPGGTRSHPRRCADAWGVGGGSCVGVKAAGGYGRREGGVTRHVKACLCANGRPLGRLDDFQMTEVD